MVYTLTAMQLSKFYYCSYLYNIIITQKRFIAYYCFQITDYNKLYQHSIYLTPCKDLYAHHQFVVCECKRYYYCWLPYHLFLSLRELHFSHQTITMTQYLMCYTVCEFSTQLLNKLAFSNLMFNTLPKIVTKQLFSTLSKNIVICLFDTLPYDKTLLFYFMVFARISLMLMAIVR